MRYEELGDWDNLPEEQKAAFEASAQISPSKLGSYVAVFDSVFSEEECEKIIDFYNKSVALGHGYEGVSGLGKVDKKAKDSTDLQIFIAGHHDCPKGLRHEVDDKFYKWLQTTFRERLLSACFQYYAEVHTTLMYESWYGIKPYLKSTMCPPAMQGQLIRLNSCQIQKFPANGNGYPALHTESDVINARSRTLAPILYLNTIDSDLGGATRIPLAQMEVQPKAGTLLVMPADFPFYHLGCTAEVDKYIITTWLEHMPMEEQLRYYELMARTSADYVRKLEDKLFEIDESHKDIFENIWKVEGSTEHPLGVPNWRWEKKEIDEKVSESN